ncbi:hypothetical protein PJI17_27000 [Mycobacterium kansasii]|uniref:Uncharacterized protein n=1 Tax=Mycobacterium kansasii ATCC 12478 TaxID=557599 RepID=U5X1Z0_MYCKA|nr:hypothetical protein MKAN_11310 [Mycobacterium kansasii ATCC 12478]
MTDRRFRVLGGNQQLEFAYGGEAPGARCNRATDGQERAHDRQRR